jgi:D-alanine transaminase
VPRTVFAFASPWPARADWQQNGLPAITANDTRWARCDIKSVSLLANVLLRQLAVDAHATEAILLRDGMLTDASASSVHVVVGGELRTPPNSWKLLPGTTRGLIEEVAFKAGVSWRSAPVTEAELRGADEILIGAATREVQPITTLDGKPVGNGKPGPVWRKLFDAYQAYKREVAGTPW